MGDLSLSLEPSAKLGGNGGTEVMHVMARSARKGRRDADDAEACVVASTVTLPLVVAYFCSCCRKGNFQALMCSTTRRQRHGDSDARQLDAKTPFEVKRL